MDVTTISGASAFAQAQVATNVQTSVAAKSLDAQRQQGAAAIELLQAAAAISSPAKPGSLDVTA